MYECYECIIVDSTMIKSPSLPKRLSSLPKQPLTHGVLSLTDE